MSSVDILVPDLPESVADATVATWHKKPGDAVKRDEVLVEIETDKVVLEVSFGGWRSGRGAGRRRHHRNLSPDPGSPA